MKIKLCIALLLACGVAFVISQNTVLADHQWGNYHWARQTTTFTLELGDNVDSSWDSYLMTSVVDWSQSSVIDLVAVPGGTRPRQCKITTGRVEVCNDTYGNNGWLGVAGITVSGSHITGSYVKLNDTYYNTPTYNTPAWRNLVMCQEIGHAFGLDHQDEDFNNANLGTCMDYTNNPNSNQHPNAHDYEMIEIIYAHLDDTTTVGGGGGDDPPCRGRGCRNNNANIDLNNPREWGQVIARDNQGRAVLYMRELGNGKKHFTHIYPVPHLNRGNDGGDHH